MLLLLVGLPSLDHRHTRMLRRVDIRDKLACLCASASLHHRYHPLSWPALNANTLPFRRKTVNSRCSKQIPHFIRSCGRAIYDFLVIVVQQKYRDSVCNRVRGLCSRVREECSRLRRSRGGVRHSAQPGTNNVQRAPRGVQWSPAGLRWCLSHCAVVRGWVRSGVRTLRSGV